MYKLFILSLLVISAYCQNSRPTFTIYNDIDMNAPYIYKFHEDVPKLDTLPIENGYRICVDGVWLSYSDVNYTGNVRHPMALYNHCSKYIPGPLPYQSLRVIGDPANYSTPAVSFFTKNDFNDDNGDPPALKFEDDPNLEGKYASFILNGDQPITLYSETNFGGWKLCFLSMQWNGVAKGVHNLEAFGMTPDMLKSFRFGLHCKPIEP